MNAKPRILLFADWFWPGYKAGGPISAAINFVQYMQDDYTIYVFTTDRDLNAAGPYTNVPGDTWYHYKHANVYYCSPRNLGYKKIRSIIEEIQPHYIYLNSLFSRYFTIYPLLLCKQATLEAKIVFAPRGMLKASALQFKAFKKKMYLFAFRKLGLHKNIFFQATDVTEETDIKKQFGHQVQVSLVPDFPEYVQAYPETTSKQAGILRVIFVGRLHPIKQLDYLLQLLPGVDGTLQLTVVGDEEDKAYAGHCRKIAASLPANIKVIFTGGVPNSDLPALFAQHHIFALPTQGENFGHAIFEALAQGKPVIISDQTPWKHLASKHAGFDLPLSEPRLFRQALIQTLEMDQPEYDIWSRGAWQVAKDFADQPNIKTAYIKLFN